MLRLIREDQFRIQEGSKEGSDSKDSLSFFSAEISFPWDERKEILFLSPSIRVFLFTRRKYDRKPEKT